MDGEPKEVGVLAVLSALEDQVNRFETRRRLVKRSPGKPRGRFLAEGGEIEERRRLMSEIEAGLGKTGKELAIELGYDASTWGKWKSHVASPKPPDIQRLREIATGKARSEEPSSEQLLLGHNTHGVLRLFFNVVEWKNVILCFRRPWPDYDIVLNMAILALRGRGCKVIYLFESESQLPNAQERSVGTDAKAFASEFAMRLESMLGRKYAAMALSRIAFVQFKRPSHWLHQDFSVWNYPNLKGAVAYEYFDLAARKFDIDHPPEDKTARWWEEAAQFYSTGEYLTERAGFRPQSVNSQLFKDLRDGFDSLIRAAFNQIDTIAKKHFADFWASDVTSVRQLVKSSPEGDLDGFIFKDYREEGKHEQN